ncbi:MAG: peptidylprolyl isomerase [Candidatus Omnitrophica bacterium]|nr:peptidylprolyl isomerase [Candidatus Omnitrophota bacterium]
METNLPKKRKIFDRRSIFFSGMTLLLFLGLFLYLGKIDRTIGSERNPARVSGWDAAKMREYANRLKANGLTEQAAQAFEDYLQRSHVDDRTRANIYYTVGEMFFQGKKYEDALSYFYKTEIANPDFPLKSELGTYIVACLENMGKGLDAEYQLESRATLSGEEREKKPSGEVVARIGNREITMGEVNAQIEKLPPWLSDEFKKDETRKLEFLQNYVAGELLFEKGRKLGLDKDPEVRERIADYQKELIIQKTVSQEITGKVKAEPEDVRNYYEAHKDRYKTEAKLKFEHILTDSKEKAEEILAKISSGSDFHNLAQSESTDEATKKEGGQVAGWVYEGGAVPAFDYDKEATQKLFALEKGGAPVVIQSSKGFHVVRVTDKEPERQKFFTEVQRQVEYEYRKEKETRLSQEMLGKLLQAKDVEIHVEKFLKKAEPQGSQGVTETSVSGLPEESKETKGGEGQTAPEDKNS